MIHPYGNLLTCLPETIADPSRSYQYLTERHLQALWYEQKYFRPLKTSAGETIHVLSPGIWNGEAGPDFLQAHLKIGDQELRGSIELHLTEDQWNKHGHQNDSRYENVILHVAFWNSKKPQELRTQSGRPLAQSCVESALTVSPVRLIQLIDLDLYPYKKFVGSGRCAKNLFLKMPEDKVAQLFELAADWRLTQKFQQLQALGENPELYLGFGLARALGYKHNADSFCQLFSHFLEQKDKDEKTLFTLGLTIFGFFEEPFTERWKESAFYEDLKSLKTNTTFRLSIQTHQIRPMNHPVRRLVYLVKLMNDPNLYTIHKRLIDWWKASWSNYSPIQLRRQITSFIPTYEDLYWNTHYTFETKMSPITLPLMGHSLIEEVCVNTLLPLIHRLITDPAEMNVFHKLYLLYPAAKKGKSRYLQHRFFGDTPKGNLLQKAMREQGAYQLHRDFCSHYEASCEGCPFIERYEAEFG